MATLNLSRLKEALTKALTPWFLGREQAALVEAIRQGGEETLLAVDVDIDALQAQLTNLYSNAGATAIGIADAGGYFSGTNVEAALQQVGASAGSGVFQAVDADLTAISAVIGTNTYIKRTGVNVWTELTPVQVKTDLALVKGDVGLSNVDNTNDASKSVSAATQAALNLKADSVSPTFTGTVGGITKAMVGLGNVDNTADTAKPVSTAQQTALNLKANLASPTFTGTVTTGTLNVINDLTVYRSVAPTTGVIYFGNSTTRYLFYDGVGYVMPGASLTVNGGQVWTSVTFDPATKLNTTNPAVVGNMSMGSVTGQRINLYTTDYGIGIQNNTQYFRASSTGGFAWHKGGVHSDVTNDPGVGGVLQADLSSAGTYTAHKLTAYNSSGAYFSGNGSGIQYTGTFHISSSAVILSANGAAWIRVPRTFVQAVDPGAQAQDGDLWFW